MNNGASTDGEGQDHLRPMWLSTRLVLRVAGRSIDLDALPAAALATIAAPLALPLTIVTAHNPDGIPRSSKENRRRSHELRDLLDERGLRWRPAVGRAQDGSWAEFGFAVGGLTDEESARLGAIAGQLAVFVVSDEEIAVLACGRSFRDARPRYARGGGAA